VVFQKEISQKTQNGGELINLGGVLHPWAHQESSGGSNSLLGQACCFKLKPPAHLGVLGGKLLLHFSYKMALGAEGKGFNTFGNHISFKISEERKKEGEKSRSRHFRNASVIKSVNVLRRSSFVLRCSSIFD